MIASSPEEIIYSYLKTIGVMDMRWYSQEERMT
jgi:hypothetical protein